MVSVQISEPKFRNLAIVLCYHTLHVLTVSISRKNVLNKIKSYIFSFTHADQQTQFYTQLNKQTITNKPVLVTEKYTYNNKTQTQRI